VTTHLRWNLSSGHWMCELAITSLGVAVSPGRRRFFVSSWLSPVGLKKGFCVHHRYLVVSCLSAVVNSLREGAQPGLETM
jgi:hypothetical protein